jgi:hypothetical protein
MLSFLASSLTPGLSHKYVHMCSSMFEYIWLDAIEIETYIICMYTKLHMLIINIAGVIE